MTKFEKDLEVGQKAEQLVAGIFRDKGFDVKFNESKDIKELRECDLIVSKEGKEYKVEVKNDLLCFKTGNVAIEHRCILSSKADFIVYVIKEKGVYYAPLRNFKFIITGTVPGINLNGGDGGRSYMKLVKFAEFMKYNKELV